MDKFEELKFLHEKTETFSERRQTTTQTYLTINTAIFGALAFLAKDSGLHRWDLLLVVLPLFGVGILACIIWLRIIQKLDAIIGWHYEQLREIERSIPESHQLINKEWERFFDAKQGRRFSFSSLEAQLPSVLIILYAAYAIGLAIAVAQSRI
ncbi:MAG TPA: hypothetical protein VMJ64_09925 [Anaerolineales bacterium]|nr:hypothetical protein [Anaerolineales bacterium]